MHIPQPHITTRIALSLTLLLTLAPFGLAQSNPVRSLAATNALTPDKVDEAADANTVIEYDLRTGQTTEYSADPAALAEKLKTTLLSGRAGLASYAGENAPSSHRDNTPNRLPNQASTESFTPVSVNNVYPWRAVAKVVTDMPNGTTYCSGVMIGNQHVLTAARCVYKPADGGLAKDATVTPGQTDSSVPYLAKATKIRLLKAFKDNYAANNKTKWDNDYAVITLDKPIGLGSGWLGFKLLNDSEFLQDDLVLRTGGYPILYSYTGGQLHRDETLPGSVELVGSEQLKTDLALNLGTVGSPLFIKLGTNDYRVVGVMSHAEYDYKTYSTRISVTKFSQITLWMMEDLINAY